MIPVIFTKLVKPPTKIKRLKHLQLNIQLEKHFDQLTKVWPTMFYI